VPEALNLLDDRRPGRREAALALLDALERRIPRSEPKASGEVHQAGRSEPQASGEVHPDWVGRYCTPAGCPGAPSPAAPAASFGAAAATIIFLARRRRA